MEELYLRPRDGANNIKTNIMPNHELDYSWEQLDQEMEIYFLEQEALYFQQRKDLLTINTTQDEKEN